MSGGTPIQTPPQSKSRLPLSVSIITLNEQDHLQRCLESVKDLAEEIIVIDSGSTDRTGEIARQCGATFEFHSWAGYIGQKNFALQQCTQPWILCLDADEWLSPELEASIRHLFAGGDPCSHGYLVDRLNLYVGGWIHHSWSPEWRLRLVRRGQGQWSGLDPHDKLEVEGPTTKLKGHLLHEPFESVQEHIEKTIKFGRLGAESYVAAGRKCRWYNLAFSPMMAWLKIILIKQGWRDGWRGWVIAGSRWMGDFVKYCYLHEFQRRENDRRE